MNNEVLINKIKGNLIGLVCLIAAFIIAFKVYQGKESEILALKKQKVNEEEKNAVLDQIINLEKKLASLQDNVNNKNMSLVLDKITDFAKAASVKIIKIIPSKDKLLKQYPQMYHAMSADIGRETVFKDIADWIKKDHARRA